MEKIIVANWKMNGSDNFVSSFASSLSIALSSTPHRVIICPPFPFLGPLRAVLGGTRAKVGAQNCYIGSHGAFTGEVSAPMLADMGCCAVITGHSERRALFQETDEDVKAKASAIHAAGMTAIICIGESLVIRQAGNALEAVVRQLKASLPDSATSYNTLIAYEPIWAIGTGLAASPAEIIEMHTALHSSIPLSLPVLYGGSVTAENGASIFSLPYVEGVLVGGASLQPEAFQKIIAQP